MAQTFPRFCPRCRVATIPVALFVLTDQSQTAIFCSTYDYLRLQAGDVIESPSYTTLLCRSGANGHSET